MIHPTAIVDSKAEIHESVQIGAYSIIGAEATIDEETSIGPHVVIQGDTTIGKRNRIFQFSSIGEIPQDKKYRGENTQLVIGDDNLIREYCSFNIGTDDGGGVTKIGDHNWIMAYVHIAHDCQVGSHTILANNATLAGHVTVQDHAILGGFVGVHQFCTIGELAFLSMNSSVRQDVPPYITVSGNPAAPRGLNLEGLKRRGVSSDAMAALKQAYKILYRSQFTLNAAIEALSALAQECEEVSEFQTFLSESLHRGVVR
ncbi:MAG TPA: acyl-[acyl-carrier-protein]--UDP-N-acetylglucosamine O-acyltransferase [Gammaproteobacteria bacterium]|nr:acyl-[acyl-carrier-protein]--UDP-N-acetylglucosamine O-acyltransferase [Gammaproteobacteria bacterium]